jgi:hypothetical protein
MHHIIKVYQGNTHTNIASDTGKQFYALAASAKRNESLGSMGKKVRQMLQQVWVWWRKNNIPVRSFIGQGERKNNNNKMKKEGKKHQTKYMSFPQSVAERTVLTLTFWHTQPAVRRSEPPMSCF